MPQPPQLLGSSWVFTHFLPHSVLGHPHPLVPVEPVLEVPMELDLEAPVVPRLIELEVPCVPELEVEMAVVTGLPVTPDEPWH
jgi:hypothetical protein